MQDNSQPEPPRRDNSASRHAQAEPKDAIFTSIMWIMIANVLVGAVLAIAAETMHLPPAVGQVGLGLVLVCGGIYFFFRWFQRKEARRRLEQNGGSDPE
ncbi:hypothetical protein [Denitrobaculum tricleocarpae]|uniref:Uncharacterized protein n=1 Tax=Denitrobaculum tricleocarpae TaxID=2591009 RepID=A0A545TRM9_9PROT|nr:hypothetical protein [Denitrobaculum tricleocarpae]TQV79874.1 hypothetical protein FKG95_14410 [Denitrobaculum tricleocarpae]